jgi:hypothetical protein
VHDVEPVAQVCQVRQRLDDAHVERVGALRAAEHEQPQLVVRLRRPHVVVHELAPDGVAELVDLVAREVAPGLGERR